jgi:hypothetical protein
VKLAQDQHFTDTDLAVVLIDSLVLRLDPDRIRRYIEPSCGDGAFFKALLEAGIPRRQIRTNEIDPSLPADVHIDYLESTSKTLGIVGWNPANNIVCGNPPFGRNGALARAFINKSAERAHWICFVVPRSMHGARGCSSLNPRLELIYEHPLEGGFSTTKAKCNWQEWFLLPEGCTGRRPTEVSADPEGLYTLVSVGENHNIVIQRCGGSAGRVTTCNGTGQGKYYIRSPYPDVVRAFKNLGKHEESDLTTHQYSLSGRMLHQLLERQLLRQYITKIKEKP